MTNETVTRYYMNRELRRKQANRLWIFVFRTMSLTAGFLIGIVAFLFFFGPLDW